MNKIIFLVVRAKIISTDWEAELARAKKPVTLPTREPTTEEKTTKEATTAAKTKPVPTKQATTEAPMTESIATTEPVTEGIATTEGTTTTMEEATTTTKAATEAPSTVAPETAATTSATIATEEARVTTAEMAKVTEDIPPIPIRVKTIPPMVARKATTEAKENTLPPLRNEVSSESEDSEEPEPQYKPAYGIGGSPFFFRPKKLRVELRKIYKGVSAVNTKVGEQFNITFMSMHSANIKEGEVYLLSGFKYGKTLTMNNCNWHAQWDDLTDTQKLGLRRYYWLYCRCNIWFCPEGACAQNIRLCRWVLPRSQIDGKKADMLSANKVCMVKCGRCGWFGPKERVDCGSLIP